ncbi:glycosyltransferase [Streptomyces sp. NPDC101219]|uniref:glycosyltransferase n=1 Tax=Streptomyces sp. NPDC101219 TaxID=3366131 RepID=UPI00380FAB86
MKFAELLELAHVSGGVPDSRLASDLALITSVSADLADTPLRSSDPAELAERYASHIPRPVSAVVLTLNEEEHIARCLDALGSDVDACLLIDSGSTDGTVDQALRVRGDARVVHAAWADDFSRQRNLAFDEVADGWLCHVDADEVLTSTHRGRLRRVLSLLDHLLPDTDFVVSPVIADTDDGPVYTNTQRVLRTSGPFRFRGRVHEHPYGPDGSPPARVQVDVRFDHFGYLPEVIEKRGKRDLYHRLDELSRSEEPDNPKWVYYQVRDGIDPRSVTERDLRSAFSLLAAHTPDVVPAGPPCYRSERVADAWSLLCELALGLGDAAALKKYTALLREAGRTVEATYYGALGRSSGLLRELSALVDEIDAARDGERPDNRHLMARLLTLQSTLALASGRYDRVVPAYRDAAERGGGQGMIQDFRMLAGVLEDVPHESV